MNRGKSFSWRAFAWAPYVLLVGVLGLYAAAGLARPGGGQSFGGRSGGGSGRGSGGGGVACIFDVLQILYYLVELTVESPTIGVPLDILIVVVIVVAFRQKGRSAASWSTTAASEQASIQARPSRAVRRDLLATVTRVDPSFSIVLFEDFVYALFGAVQEARGKQTLATLAPYVDRDVRTALTAASANLSEVQTPVIGALRYVDVAGFDTQTPIRVTLEIEANFTEVTGTARQTLYVVERWTLSRAPTARSREPQEATILGCPNCGAPLSDIRGNTCGYCKQVVDTGAFDWLLIDVDPRDRMNRAPQLTSDVEETGTSLPTVIDPDAAARLRALGQRDPAFQWPQLMARVGVIFTAIQPAWSERDGSIARPYVSDQLFQMLGYWIESYKRERLRNVSKNARITGIELAAVISDKFYDAITVRIHATGLDYTVTDDGKVVSGSETRERAYTEYWTLIRGASVKTKNGGTGSGKECPNCGAPLAINMAGSCDHCHAKVTSGDFEWVLSRIEQDAAYTG